MEEKKIKVNNIIENFEKINKTIGANGMAHIYPSNVLLIQICYLRD